MKSASAIQAIARIDRLMDADLRFLDRHDPLRRLHFDKMTSRQRRCHPANFEAHWGDGWEQFPALSHRHHMLQRQRNTYQDARDKALNREYAAERRAEGRKRAAEARKRHAVKYAPCAACNGAGYLPAAA